MTNTAKQNRREKAKNTSFIALAGALVILAYFDIGDAEPVAHFFGLLEYFSSVVLIIIYLWKSAGQVYPANIFKKKRIYIFLSGLTSLVLVPLMAILITIQFFTLFKAYYKNTGFKNIPTSLKDENVQMYILSVVCILVGAAIYMNGMFASPSP